MGAVGCRERAESLIDPDLNTLRNTYRDTRLCESQ